MVVYDYKPAEMVPPTVEKLLEKNGSFHFGVTRLWSGLMVTVFLKDKPYAYITAKGMLPPQLGDASNDELGTAILRQLQQDPHGCKLYWAS